jgi:D-alanine-D-alanine ligase
MIIKPKNEAVSFGLKIVNSEQELREGAQIIFNQYRQPVLAEQYIEGKEINVGLLGNNPPETFPPVELIFGEGAPPIYTYEDKVHRSGRTVAPRCPAELSSELTDKVKELAIKAFSALGCYDCSRVDFRMDNDGNFYILEINSLASLGVGGSYVAAAKEVGLDYTGLINRLVEVASARYYGTPSPPELRTVKIKDKKEAAFSFLTQRRDGIERRLERWCGISSRTDDTVGIKLAYHEIDQLMSEIKLKKVDKYTDEPFVGTWASAKGYEGGTLLICHLDTPVLAGYHPQSFRRDPEYLYGEGIGSTRAPLTMLEFSLRALRSLKVLRTMPLGILIYADEGREAQYSEKIIKAMSGRAARVLVLRPGNPDGSMIHQRRGLVGFQLSVEGVPIRLGQAGKRPQTLLWFAGKLSELAQISSRKRRIAVSVTDVKTEAFPMLLPHRVSAKLLVNYYDGKILSETVSEIGKRLMVKSSLIRSTMEKLFDRPPMINRRANQPLFASIRDVAQEWEISFQKTSSLWPSVAGLIPKTTPVICGMGPAAENLYTPQETVQRISMIQRTLLLTQYLLKTKEKS